MRTKPELKVETFTQKEQDISLNFLQNYLNEHPKFDYLDYMTICFKKKVRHISARQIQRYLFQPLQQLRFKNKEMIFIKEY